MTELGEGLGAQTRQQRMGRAPRRIARYEIQQPQSVPRRCEAPDAEHGAGQHENGDDGDLQSHDGCGGCQLETGAWTAATPTLVRARRQHAIAYDAGRGVVVLFGGYDGTYLNDTWEWNGSAWREGFSLPGEAARERELNLLRVRAITPFTTLERNLGPRPSAEALAAGIRRR